MNESIVKYVSVALAWSAYFALHSMMISITVTEYLKRELQDRFRSIVFSSYVVALLPWSPYGVLRKSVEARCCLDDILP